MSRSELIQSGKSREIGKRIKSLREAMQDTDGQSMSQESFGKLLGGLSLPKINRIENGRRMPDIEFLLMLKEKINFDLDWLLTGKGKDQDESKISAKKEFLSRLKTDPEFRSEVLVELKLNYPTESIRHERIYNMLKSQRADWQEIVDRTEQSLEGMISKSKKQEALESIKKYKDGISYLNVLMEIGRDKE